MRYLSLFIFFSLSITSVAGAEKPSGQTRVAVRFSSRPAGASVFVDGEYACHPAPCTFVVEPGSHTVSMQAEGYRVRRQTVDLTSGASLKWKLTPAFGWLEVQSKPPGLRVKINGHRAGITPMAAEKRPAGNYRVVVFKPEGGIMDRLARVSCGKKTLVRFLLQDKATSVKIGKMVVKGSIEKKEVKKSISDAFAMLRDCYERGLKKPPKHDDIFEIGIRINSYGAVKNCSLKSCTVLKHELQQCIIDTLGNLSFTVPNDAKEQDVTFSLVFEGS